MKKTIVFMFLILIMPISVLADTGKSTIVMDIDSGRILYKNNINDRMLIASTTKIMTCIIVLENSDIESSITVGDEVLSMYGTNIYIEKGEVMRIIDLLYGLMLRSGNDAAITLAYNTLGYNEFINKMNEKANEIGMNNTIFNNPHGLDEETKNYSTAYDMALLSRYAYKNTIYRKIIFTNKYSAKSSIKSYVWYNRMSLLNNYKYCIGGKNGYTPNAGKSLVSYAKKENTTLTIVSLDDPSIYDNHKDLYSEYFAKYKNYKIIDKNNFNVKGYTIKESVFYPLKNDELDRVSTLVKIDSKSNSSVVEVRIGNQCVETIKLLKKRKQKKRKVLF